MRIVLTCAAAFFALTAPAVGQEPKVIAPGVTVAGVPVGGLAVAQATVTLEQALGQQLRSPLEVRVGRVRSSLRMGTLRLKFAPDRTARRAYRAGLKGELEVAPFVTYRRSAVRAWVTRFGRRIWRH